jgi:signal transduction histidine kinase
MRRIIILIFLFFASGLMSSAQQVKSDTAREHAKYLLEQLAKRINTLPSDSAIVVQLSALKVATQLRMEPFILFKMNSRLGDLYRLQADFTSALKCDLQSLKLAESFEDNALKGSANNSIGIDYFRMKDLESALKFFSEGMRYRLKTNDSLAIADSYYNTGMVLELLKRDDEMKVAYHNALILFQCKKSCDGEADVYNGMAGFFYRRYQFDSATYYINKGLDKYAGCGNKEAFSFMSINLAGLLTIQKKYDQAILHIQQGIDAAKEIGALSQIHRGYKNLSEAYQAKGDFKNAYENRLQYEFFNDSIFNLEQAKAFKDVMTKYETEKKERLIEQKEAEISIQNVRADRADSQRNLFIVIAALALILLFLLLWLFFEKRRSAVLLNKQNKELQQLNATKDKFFSIISHDLRSPISSFGKITGALQVVIDKLEKEQLKEYVGELDKSARSINALLNNLLQWAMGQTNTLNPEFKPISMEEAVSAAVNVVKAQAGQKQILLQTKGIADYKVNADSRMLDTILRNILSNALKFSPPNTEINIETGMRAEMGFIAISDHGHGLSDIEIGKLFRIEENVSKLGEDQAEKGAGLGLILCMELARLNKGTIEAKRNADGGMTFTVFIPLYK